MIRPCTAVETILAFSCSAHSLIRARSLALMVGLLADLRQCVVKRIYITSEIMQVMAVERCRGIAVRGLLQIILGCNPGSGRLIRNSRCGQMRAQVLGKPLRVLLAALGPCALLVAFQHWLERIVQPLFGGGRVVQALVEGSLLGAGIVWIVRYVGTGEIALRLCVPDAMTSAWRASELMF